MTIITDDKLGLVSIVGMNYDQAGVLLDNLAHHRLQRPNLAGHWRINTRKQTVSLIMLTPMQATMIDVMMSCTLRAAEEVVEAFDAALEMSVKDND